MVKWCSLFNLFLNCGLSTSSSLYMYVEAVFHINLCVCRFLCICSFYMCMSTCTVVGIEWVLLVYRTVSECLLNHFIANSSHLLCLISPCLISPLFCHWLSSTFSLTEIEVIIGCPPLSLTEIEVIIGCPPLSLS